MSKRRRVGEVVKRRPGSGFVASDKPELVRICDDPGYPCLLDCGDKHCREWANLEVVSGSHAGEFMYHISECELEDAELPRGRPYKVDAETLEALAKMPQPTDDEY